MEFYSGNDKIFSLKIALKDRSNRFIPMSC